MTDFQRKCHDRVRKLLSKHGHGSSFETVQGHEESYLFFGFVNAGKAIRIYLYEDEAGFFVDKDWYISEAQDFDDQGDLIENFLRNLETRGLEA